MHRHNPFVDEFEGGTSKIRKRAASSSSASSTLLKNCRFKRAIMVGRRGGSNTPAPIWRMSPKSPSSSSKISESSRQYGPVSARKLANALWELNKFPSPNFGDNLSARRSKNILKSYAHWLADPSHTTDSERSDHSRSSSHRRMVPRVRCKEHRHKGLDWLSNASLMEVDARSQGHTPTSTIMRTENRLKDLRSGLTSSKELLKLLSWLWGHNDQHSYGVSLLSALRVELDRARSQIDQLIQEQSLNHNEISCLKQQFMEEKSTWKIKEHKKVRSIVEELELEKKSRRRSERLNKRLGMELANTRATLSKAVKELESERRSREIIEHICNEIVRGIGEDKAEVEHMKRESAKVREELGKEREMLHIADEWREERIQMKLLEAKAQFDEKNAADQLRNELEANLENNGRINENDEEENNKRYSVESDLHSIELNMESNKDFSQSHYTNADELNQDAERYISVKILRENMLAGILLPRGSSSPTRQWNKSQACEGSKIGKIVKNH